MRRALSTHVLPVPVAIFAAYLGWACRVARHLAESAALQQRIRRDRLVEVLQGRGAQHLVRVDDVKDRLLAGPRGS